MKVLKAKTTKAAPKVTLKGVAAKAAPKGIAAKDKTAKGKKPAKVLPKGTPMSLDDTLWRLMNRPKKPTTDKAKAKDAS